MAALCIFSSMNSVFRVLIVLSAGLYLIWYFMPYYSEQLYSEDIIDVISWNGIGAILELPSWFHIVIGIAYLLTLFELLMYSNVARLLFLVFAIFFLSIAPFIGVSALTPIESMLASAMSILQGAILTMAYLTSVGAEFRPDA